MIAKALKLRQGFWVAAEDPSLTAELHLALVVAPRSRNDGAGGLRPATAPLERRSPADALPWGGRVGDTTPERVPPAADRRAEASASDTAATIACEA